MKPERASRPWLAGHRTGLREFLRVRRRRLSVPVCVVRNRRSPLLELAAVHLDAARVSSGERLSYAGVPCSALTAPTRRSACVPAFPQEGAALLVVLLHWG